MHRARQGAGAVKKPSGERGCRLAAGAAATAAVCLRPACCVHCGAGHGGWRMRPGRPHDHARGSGPARCRTVKASPVSTGAREAGSGIELRGLPWSARGPVNGLHPPAATRGCPRRQRRGESRGRSVEVRPSRPAGPHRGSRLRFRSAVCVSTAVAETRPARPRIRPRLRERGNAAPRRGTRLYYIAGPPSDYRFIIDR